MNWLFLSSSLLSSSLESVAQISIERILNALPEGILVAVFAWVLLRVLRKQNSGTRFAVWFLALLTVAALPVWGGFGNGRALMGPGMSWGRLRPAITIPGTWALFVFLAWALGASVAMARLVVGLWHLRRLRQSCTPVVAAELDPVVRKTVEAIVATMPVAISTSEGVRVPAAIGFWKRTIILPAWALRELPPEDLNVILLHEFAHLRRGDDWTNLIQKVVHALFFFHPAVWWIERRLSVEREMACDDAVLAETANPHGYAACLVSLLEKSLAHRLAGKQWAMAQAAVRRAHEASLRLAQILDSNRPMATRVWKPALGMLGAFAVVCLLTLPIAPQFVAFDREGTDAFVRSGRAPGRAQPGSNQLQSSFSPAAVIPAALRTDESLGRVTPKTVKAKVIPAHTQAAPQLTPAGVVAARMNEAWPLEQMIPISARADQEILPQFQTLVFFETTQYVTSDSTLWRVQVWHVMLLTAERGQMAKVPVVNSL
jgi:beta-lactamase regulating signal transducer with metallopeptidase domain